MIRASTSPPVPRAAPGVSWPNTLTNDPSRARLGPCGCDRRVTSPPPRTRPSSAPFAEAIRMTATERDTAATVPGGRVTEEHARQVAEAARETKWDRPSFGKDLFLGRFRLELIHPHPRPDRAARDAGEEFLATLEKFCTEHIDAAVIERDARVPDEVIRGLADIGAFGMKIDREYGGLGLSQRY